MCFVMIRVRHKYDRIVTEIFYIDTGEEQRPGASFPSSSGQHQSAIRKKRNKCSPEQLRHLESFFAKNRNPTGKIREELAKRIQMPERSVQGR